MPACPPSALPAPSLFEAESLPGMPRGVLVEPESARSILRPQRDERYGFGFALSPYRGCAHGCRYCYVREYPHAVHGMQDWGRWVAPKLNAPELIWAQRHRIIGKTVFLASATDPYQPLERDYRLTRRCLEVLRDCPGTRVVLHTRSALVLQDLDLIRGFGDRISVGLSLNTDDDTVRQVVEPQAPSIPTRLFTLERLARSGVAVTASIAPLLPMLDPAAFVARLRDSGAHSAWVGGLRLLNGDPFHALLVKNGWLRALDRDYQAEVRELVRSAFPALGGCGTGRTRRAAAAPAPRYAGMALPPRAGGHHPGLFDGL